MLRELTEIEMETVSGGTDLDEIIVTAEINPGLGSFGYTGWGIGGDGGVDVTPQGGYNTGSSGGSNGGSTPPPTDDVQDVNDDHDDRCADITRTLTIVGGITAGGAAVSLVPHPATIVLGRTTTIAGGLYAALLTQAYIELGC